MGAREIVMNSSWIRKAVLISVMAGTCLAIGCGSKPSGTYRDSDGAVTLQLNDGKASLDFGMIHLDAAYKVDGNKVTLTPLQGDVSQTMVFTVNSDGSLAGPPGSEMPRLVKAK
jgi:hypothetical protein